MDKTNEQLSYELHEQHLDETENCLKRLEKKDTIDYWRHNRMYSLLDPMLKPDSKWLTVGDGIGTDANWLQEKGMDVTASDLSDSILKKAHEKNFILKYSRENAENISSPNDSYDYVLCKEAYHHFPRPYIAIYEMLRVSKKAIVMIEPIDIGMEMPILISLKKFLDRFSTELINKVWKNRFSFEPVGNYVYKVSEREIEKIAMGINLPYVAFKGINDYYSDSLDLSLPATKGRVFSKVKRKIKIKNFLSKIGLIPYYMMACVIFKQEPTSEELKEFRDKGYKIVKMKKNPYI